MTAPCLHRPSHPHHYPSSKLPYEQSCLNSPFHGGCPFPLGLTARPKATFPDSASKSVSMSGRGWQFHHTGFSGGYSLTPTKHPDQGWPRTPDLPASQLLGLQVCHHAWFSRHCQKQNVISARCLHRQCCGGCRGVGWIYPSPWSALSHTVLSVHRVGRSCP